LSLSRRPLHVSASAAVDIDNVIATVLVLLRTPACDTARRVAEHCRRFASLLRETCMDRRVDRWAEVSGTASSARSAAQ
jgi:hypothetical protein